MPGHPHKVEELLNTAEMAEFEQFAREPGRSIDELHQWLLERGFTLARSSVGRWKQSFDQRVMAERMSRSSELAESMRAAVDKRGIEAVAEGAMKQLTQVVFEQALKLEQDGDLDALDVMRWTRSLKNLVGSQTELVELKEKLAEAQRKMDEAKKSLERMSKKDGVITGEDIAAVTKAMFG